MSTTSRSSALTVVAPLGGWGLWRSRLMFPVVKMLAPSSPLTEVRFIHFAQWSVFRSFPGGSPSAGRPTLLFVADFDGDLREYLATFGIATPHGMRWTFGACNRFPGPRPTRKLIAYVERNRCDDLLRYCAYPGATVRDVDAALDVSRRLDRLRSVDRAGDGDERLAAVTAEVVDSLTHAPDQDVPSTLWGALSTVRARPTVAPVTVAMPITATSPRRVADRIRALGEAGPALFDRIRGTHFARMSAVGDHLLLTTFVDGSPGAYIERLVAGLGPESDLLWSGCAGYPGHGDTRRLASWIAAHRLPTSLFLPARSGVPVDGIRRALARWGRAMDVVTAARGVRLEKLGEQLLEV
jgi:hypothetical protein